MKMLSEFWEFVKERESIRLRRLSGLPKEKWTDDEIFRTYSFTNVKREHDRTSVELNKIYRAHFDWNAEETGWDDCTSLLVNCALFRFFGTVEAAEVIDYVRRWTPATKERIEGYAIQNDLPFTSAYIVPNAGLEWPKYQVVMKVIDEVSKRADDVLRALHAEDGPCSWAEATEELKRCFGIGSFMAKEVLLDYLMATGYRPKDWDTWTPVGPGGARGAGWVLYGVKEKLRETQALKVIRDIYETRDKFWPKKFVIHRPWHHASPNCDNHCGCDDGSVVSHESITLDLTDIQFQLCEFDKYNRAKSGGRPKRLFRPTVDKITNGRL